MLDFDVHGLYFEEPLCEEAAACLECAAQNYGDPAAEQALYRAYFITPRHPMVLVALYRFFYYQQRLPDALLVAERVLTIYAEQLELPADWRQLSDVRLPEDNSNYMTGLRFYLLALKGSAYLQLRMGDYEPAILRLKKVLELDEKDRLGARILIDVAQVELNRRSIHIVGQ
ncbi:MAG: hypothetical protein KDJ38_10205 [Gammaproteobacteria bacterium]|nr:hypothetical protein [Gammaproteobacteria bacterium]